MPPLMPDEDENFGWPLFLDFRKCSRHVKMIYMANSLYETHP